MKLGAEPKKLAFLGILAVVGAYVIFSNSSEPGGSAQPVSRPQTSPTAPKPSVLAPVNQPASRNRSSNSRVLQEFRPSLKPKRPEDRVDPATVDPTLRLDILAKLQSVSVEGTHRSVFDFGTAPPAKPLETAKAKDPVPTPIVPVATTPPVDPEPPAPPPAPPIPLKFYGYVNPANPGPKRAFFLDGEDIHVATEGETLKKKYRIVRIGINSAVVEDTDHKSQQTLPLEEQPG